MNKFTKFAAASLAALGLMNLTTVNTKAVTAYKTLMHNAYVYQANGQRANSKALRRGMHVKVTGQATINGKKYYILVNNTFVKIANFKPSHVITTKLLHNAYIYNNKGKRIGKMKLLKGHKVACYGQPKKIHGSRYVSSGRGMFVKANNLLYYAANIPTDNGQLTEPPINQSQPTSTISQNTSVQPSAPIQPTQVSQVSNVQPTNPVQPTSASQPTQATQATSVNDTAKLTQDDWNLMGDYLAHATGLQTEAFIYADASTRYNYDNAVEVARELERNRSTTTKSQWQKAYDNLGMAISEVNNSTSVVRLGLPTVDNVDGATRDNLTKDQRDAALRAINTVCGNNDARFLSETQLTGTEKDGTVRIFDLNQYLKQNINCLSKRDACCKNRHPFLLIKIKQILQI